uniref:Uncharacterized protein n=1 Tax=Ciona intestinalis TaxID=7719 RepID=H2XMJ4_CIOIN
MICKVRNKNDLFYICLENAILTYAMMFSHFLASIFHK